MAKNSWFRKAERFVREYTRGAGADDIRRLFDRDAAQAYGVVTRDHEGTEPAGRVRRFLYRAKILFLGLSFRLAPPRRVLFAACILFAVLALQNVDPTSGSGGQFMLFHVLSVAGLVLLIVLELADRIQVRDELEVARELQRDLLPTEAPEVPGWSFAFSYRTANTIGGDYYDFIGLSDGRLAVVIGDASGHGIAAGLLMAIASSALRLAIDVDAEPASVAPFVNRALCRSGGQRAFMTLFYGVLDPATGRLDFVNAGHPYPMLRRSDGSVVELGEGGLPLGLRGGLASPTGSVTVERGEQLLLFTDGIVETINTGGSDYGYDRLRRALELGGSADAIHDRVGGEVAAFQGDAPTHDDRSLVVVMRAHDLPPVPPTGS
ncbi:MAG: PP2C family protein-serine/threonine phosphatase [Holophagae bacterium]|jgi:serine phosphatase RsbU (regulator of sigma subunit)